MALAVFEASHVFCNLSLPLLLDFLTHFSLTTEPDWGCNDLSDCGKLRDIGTLGRAIQNLKEIYCLIEVLNLTK